SVTAFDSGGREWREHGILDSFDRLSAHICSAIESSTKLRTGSFNRRCVPLRAEVPNSSESVPKTCFIASGAVRAEGWVCFEDIVDDGESVKHSLHEIELMIDVGDGVDLDRKSTRL